MIAIGNAWVMRDVSPEVLKNWNVFWLSSKEDRNMAIVICLTG
jgi:hypothetical protein